MDDANQLCELRKFSYFIRLIWNSIRQSERQVYRQVINEYLSS
jgi:hypothetical protein